MNQEYNELLEGFINKIALPENLKGTQYIKLLLKKQKKRRNVNH